MRNMMDNFKRLLIESEEKNILTEGIENSIKKYIQRSKYDILNSWGNCAFYTQDFNSIMGGKIIYMTLANPTSDDPEDHIVPVLGNTIVDFAYVPGKGVSKHDRNGIPPKFNPGSGENNWPRLTTVSKQIFEKGGTYGKLGYLRNSKYAGWEYESYPNLEKGQYPIILNSLPSYATVEPPKEKTTSKNPE